MKYLFLAGLLYVLYLLGRRFIRHKLHGKPRQRPAGPRTITLVALAVVLVYAVWAMFRLVGSHV